MFRNEQNIYANKRERERERQTDRQTDRQRDGYDITSAEIECLTGILLRLRYIKGLLLTYKPKVLSSQSS